METVVSEFSETTASGSSLQRSGRGDVQDRWYAGGCAHPGHVRSQSPTSGNAATQTFEFLGTDGGWSPKLGDTVIPSDRYREKQNWRGRRYDLSRLKTMFMDGASVREASTTTATRQAIAQPEFRRILVAVPLSGRESAGASENLRTRTMETSQVCAPLHEKRTCQPKLVRARSIGPGTLQALQQRLAFSIASWSRLSDTASNAPCFVIELFIANTVLQQFFLNTCVRCAKLDPFFLMTTQFFRRAMQEILRQVVGPSPRCSRRRYLRSQLPENTDLCEARHDPGDCQP